MIKGPELHHLDELFEMYERARRVSSLQQRGPVVRAAQFAEEHITKLIQDYHIELSEKD